MLTVKELEDYAIKYMQEEFALEMGIPIKLNGRLTKGLGQFVYSYNEGAVKIELSKKLVQYNDNETVLDVLYHELIHYALFLQGLPFDDRDQTFIEACESRNVGLTKTGRYKLERHVYQCRECGRESNRGTRLQKGRYYSCRRCKMAMPYIGKRVMEV